MKQSIVFFLIFSLFQTLYPTAHQFYQQVQHYKQYLEQMYKTKHYLPAFEQLFNDEVVVCVGSKSLKVRSRYSVYIFFTEYLYVYETVHFEFVPLENFYTYSLHDIKILERLMYFYGNITYITYRLYIEAMDAYVYVSHMITFDTVTEKISDIRLVITEL